MAMLLMKNNVYFGSLVLAVMFTCVMGGCSESKVSGLKSYVADDAQVLTHVPFVAEFELSCDENTDRLYAQLDSAVLPVIQVEQNKWMVSWTTDIQEARSGDLKLNILDEENKLSFIRNLDNDLSPEESLKNVKVITQLTIPFAGAYKGPWVNSELLALALALAVAYVAYTSKNALLA